MSDTLNNKYKEKYLKYKIKYLDLKNQEFNRNPNDQEKYLNLKNQEFNSNPKKQIGGKYDLEILNESILINDIIYTTPVEIRESLIRNKIIPIIVKLKDGNPTTIVIQFDNNETVLREINNVCSIIENMENFEIDKRTRLIKWIEKYNNNFINLTKIPYKDYIMRKYNKLKYDIIKLNNDDNFYNFITIRTTDIIIGLLLYIMDDLILIEDDILLTYCRSKKLDNNLLISKKNQLLQDLSVDIPNSINLLNKTIDNFLATLYWRNKFIILKPEYKPDYIYKGGVIAESDKIWPIIQNIFSNNGNQLKLCGMYGDKDVVITILNPKILNYKDEEPIFGRGSYTAVYLVDVQGTNFILRLTKKTKYHILYLKKILSEYIIYNKNLIEIILHGVIQTKKENITCISTDLNDTFKITNFDFNYVITKRYNSEQNLHLFSHKNRYTILMNLLILLQKMYTRGEFHADLKLSNIGWNNSFDIILIDYDQFTIKSVKEAEDYFYSASFTDSAFYKTFASTHRPKYTSYDIDLNNIKDMCKYNMFSISGLAHCIYDLKIKLTDNSLLSDVPIFKNLLNTRFKRDGLNTPEFRTYNELNDFTYDKLILCLEEFRDLIK